VSGEELSRGLGVTRSAVWKHVESLRAAGYAIAAAPHRGYRFGAAPDRLLPDEIRARLGTRLLGREILSFETVDSTNRVALELGARGSPEGAVVFAEEQTRGRGRLGRTWSSPKGKGLTFSVLLRPVLAIQEVPRLTLTAAVSVAEALREEAGVRAEIRWPNDVLVSGRKICGILTEMNAEPDRVLFVVVGIGLNVNARPEDLPEGAASLLGETGRAWDRCALAAEVLGRLETHYGQLVSGRFADLAARWESYSGLTGRRVAASTLRGSVEGEALGIDEEGALWIREDTGLRTKVLSGDVLILR
jgi:BirA family biotin operon repressor/biotin-[acetyl-CoA-carboxylase] ligase